MNKSRMQCNIQACLHVISRKTTSVVVLRIVFVVRKSSVIVTRRSCRTVEVVGSVTVLYARSQPRCHKYLSKTKAG
jgi:hypothetical protein